MKNNKNIKTGLLVSVLFSFMSGSVFAEAEQNTDSVSNTVVGVGEASSYAKEFSEGQTEFALLKQKLQKAQLLEQINIIKEKQEARKNENILKEKQKKWDEEKKELIDKYEDKIKSLQESTDKKDLSTKEQNEAVLDSVFVTRISGIGKNMRARIYINNTIATKGAGEFVGDHIKILSVHDDGVKVTYKGATKFIPITTINRAQYKSFEQTGATQKEMSDSQSKSNGIIGIPSVMPSGMPTEMPAMPTM